MQVTILGKGICRSLRIVEVTDGDIGSPGLNFTSNVLRIFGVDADFGRIDSLAAGARDIVLGVRICKQRCGLGHTVTHRVRQAYLPEYAFHVRIERSATHDEFLHIASEGCHQLADYGVVNHLVDSRDSGKDLHIPLGKHRLDGALVNLFHYERHGDDEIRLDLSHRLEQRGCARSLAEVIDRNSAGERVEEFEHKTVDMSHWEHRNYAVRVGCRYVPDSEVDGGAERLIGEHNSLGSAGGSGSVVDNGEVLPVVGRIVYVLATEPVRISGGKVIVHRSKSLCYGIVGAPQKRVVLVADCSLQSRDSGLVHLGPGLLVDKQQLALGVMHEGTDAFRGKFCQERHHDGPVTVNGKERYRPTCRVGGAESDLVTLLQTDLFKENSELGYIGCQVSKTKLLAVPVAYGGLVPASSGCFL